MGSDRPIHSISQRASVHRRGAATVLADRPRPALLGSGALVTATLLLLASPDSGLGQTISVSVPHISIQVPRVEVPRVSVDVGHAATAVTQSVGQVTAAIHAAVPAAQLRVDPAQVTISVGGGHGVSIDLPDVANGGLGHEIAASAAAAVAAATDHLGFAHGAAATANHGLAALVGPGGVAAQVQAHTGAVTMASGTVLTVDFYGDGLINFAVDGEGPAVAGRGAAVTNGGTITLSAAAVNSIVDRAVNMDGVALTQAIAAHDGRISLVTNTAVVAVDDARGSTHGRADPLTELLADADFRPGSYGGGDLIRYGDAEHEPTSRDSSRGWGDGEGRFFGSLGGAHGGSGSSDSGATVEARPSPRPLPSEPADPVPTLLDPDGTPEEEEQLAEAVAVLAQIETVVGREELTPTDVCQTVGGGGVGLPGCGSTESFGAVVSLEPDATGSGCALLAATGGIRLSCGGGPDALPSLPDSFNLPAPEIDSTTTLQDLMDIWLQEPAEDLPLSIGGGQLAAAGHGAAVY